MGLIFDDRATKLDRTSITRVGGTFTPRTQNSSRSPNKMADTHRFDGKFDDFSALGSY